MSGPRETWFLDLGMVDYGEVWTLQKELVERRSLHEIPDVLIVVEHPHVITLGRKRPLQSSFHAPDLHIPVYYIERGGAATYHGPGQLVGYPIVKLEGNDRDLHRYLRDLEEFLIETLRDFGIACQRKSGATGVWTTKPVSRKIASMGVAVRHWTTYHGFALNVSTDLRYFRLISPCGFDASIMTSMEQELGEAVHLTAVQERLRQHYEECFGVQLRAIAPEVLDVKVLSVTRG